MLAASSASSDAGYSERTLGLQHLVALDLGRRAALASQPRAHEINSRRFPSKSASRNNGDEPFSELRRLNALDRP